QAPASRLAGSMDVSVLHTTETIIIEWSQQIRDILSKDSVEPLLEGLHPLPRAEFDFWHTRTVNLQCISDQLLSPRVTVLAEMLEKANSCFWPALQSVFQDVSAGLEEAEDISFHLQPLCILCGLVQPGSADPRYPRSPTRVVVILQEICNLLIDLVEPPPRATPPSSGTVAGGVASGSCGDPSSGDVETPSQGTSKEDPQLWDFPPSIIFRRMESFLHRLKMIEDLYQTAIVFLKLEKAELGGVKGHILGTQVFQIYNEAAEIIKVFAACKYDSLDPTEEVDFAEFQEKIEDMDRRLATIFCQGFHDCSSLMSAGKLVHMFSYLLERPVIKAELSPHYSALLEMFKAELEDVKVLYDTQISSPLLRGTGPAINKNMPPVAGQLKWASELQERLEGPYKDLFSINHPYTLFAQSEMLQKLVDNLDLITGWYNEAGHKGETARLLFHALSTGQAKTGRGAPAGRLLEWVLEAEGRWGAAGASPSPHILAAPSAEPSCCCHHTAWGEPVPP
uniref:Dynein heavy chain tail domain-containing protein n=1 Tax=Amazona collaria TaxID=241587 RepID=A0A8B9GAX8_9PSIT